MLAIFGVCNRGENETIKNLVNRIEGQPEHDIRR